MVALQILILSVGVRNPVGLPRIMCCISATYNPETVVDQKWYIGYNSCIVRNAVKTLFKNPTQYFYVFALSQIRRLATSSSYFIEKIRSRYSRQGHKNIVFNGDYSVEVRTPFCEIGSMGSFPISHPTKSQGSLV